MCSSSCSTASCGPGGLAGGAGASRAVLAGKAMLGLQQVLLLLTAQRRKLGGTQA